MQKRYFYAYENPYGLESLNSNGVQANVMMRFKFQADRDNWVDEDPERREALHGNHPVVRQCKRQNIQFPVNFFE